MAETLNHSRNSAAANLPEVSSSLPDLSSASISLPGQNALFSMLRSAGLGAAVLGSSLGLTGFAERRAEGGIVVSILPDGSYVDQGAGYAGAYRGPGIDPSGGALFFSLEYDLPNYGTVTRNTSATWINSYHAITNAHNYADIAQYNPRLSVGTGPNFRTQPGSVTAVESILIHPSYSGTAAGGNGLDLAILKFSTPFSGGSQMAIAGSTPGTGSLVNTAGYGVTGTTTGGAIFPQDGNIRGGVIELSGIPATNFGDPDIYKSLFFRDSESILNIRPYFGDSGSPVFNLNNELLGINSGGGLSASDRFSYYLDLTPPERASYVRENTNIAAVPEPSSLVLAGGLAALAAGWRVLRSRNERASSAQS